MGQEGRFASSCLHRYKRWCKLSAAASQLASRSHLAAARFLNGVQARLAGAVREPLQVSARHRAAVLPRYLGEKGRNCRGRPAARTNRPAAGRPGRRHPARIGTPRHHPYPGSGGDKAFPSLSTAGPIPFSNMAKYPEIGLLIGPRRPPRPKKGRRRRLLLQRLRRGRCPPDRRLRSAAARPLARQARRRRGAPHRRRAAPRRPPHVVGGAVPRPGCPLPQPSARTGRPESIRPKSSARRLSWSIDRPVSFTPRLSPARRHAPTAPTAAAANPAKAAQPARGHRKGAPPPSSRASRPADNGERLGR
jgi:hypothetical protein